MLDFARAMPPEAPRDKSCRQTNDHLYRLLRPEFVLQYRAPLNSDGFSNMILADPRRRQYNEQLKEATKELIEVLVPRYALELVQFMSEQDMLSGGIENIQINQHLHARGINVRFLGKIAACVRVLDHEYGPVTHRFIMIEMCSRVLKAILRQKLRDTMKLYRVPLEEPYMEQTVEFLNVAFGTSPASAEFWENVVKPIMLEKFGKEALPSHQVNIRKLAMKSNVSKTTVVPSSKMLFLRLQKQIGFVLSNHVQKKIRFDNKGTVR